MKSVEEMDTLLAEEGLEVKHYGTKGMKWGVRKRRNEAARAQKFGASKDAKRASAAAKKAKTSGIKSLTNQELKDLNQRNELESKLLKTIPKSSAARGAAFATAILGGVAASQAKSIANNSASKAMSAATARAASKRAAAAAAKMVSGSARAPAEYAVLLRR